MTIRKVAIIGVGQMGAPMARNIHSAGFELTVCDRNEATLQLFADMGVHRITKDASECADCDVVIVLVATPEQTRQVLTGAAGLADGISVNKPIVVVMGTVPPSEMLAIGEVLDDKGIVLVDAPVSGGMVGAQDATLAIMVGGPSEVFDRLLPLMKCMGSSIFHCGALGTGQATKIVNNIMGITTQMVAAEAYRICLDNGLKLKDAMPVFDAGSGRNFFSRDSSDATRAYSAWTDTREDFVSLQAIMRKDIGLALALGENVGPLPMINAVSAVLQNVGEETFETWRAIGAAE